MNTNGAVVGSFNVPRAYHNGLEWDNGGLWTNTGDTEFSHYLTDGTIDTVAALTGVPAGTLVRDIAIGDGTVYVSNVHSIFIDEEAFDATPPPPPSDPIPEPSSLILFLVGIIGTATYGWRKRRKTA